MVTEIGSTIVNETTINLGLKAIGAGIAIGLTGIGAGNAEMGIGAASVGAIAEDKNFFGTGIILTLLPETIVIFGFVVGLLILFL
ncbi:ATPase [Methanoregula sp.]|uniref:ATPase n=1 Tax=Methanoregula sp. TaxID=2052170 RepID=UPI00356989B6